jgi:hypothetical protein
MNYVLFEIALFVTVLRIAFFTLLAYVFGRYIPNIWAALYTCVTICLVSAKLSHIGVVGVIIVIVAALVGLAQREPK